MEIEWVFAFFRPFLVSTRVKAIKISGEGFESTQPNKKNKLWMKQEKIRKFEDQTKNVKETVNYKIRGGK